MDEFLPSQLLMNDETGIDMYRLYLDDHQTIQRSKRSSVLLSLVSAGFDFSTQDDGCRIRAWRMRHGSEATLK